MDAHLASLNVDHVNSIEPRPALFREGNVGVQGAGLLVDRWQCASPSSGVAVKLGFRSQRKETRNPMETFTRVVSYSFVGPQSKCVSLRDDCVCSRVARFVRACSVGLSSSM